MTLYWSIGHLIEMFNELSKENLSLKLQLSELETVMNRQSPVNFYGNGQRATLVQMLEYLLEGKKPC